MSNMKSSPNEPHKQETSIFYESNKAILMSCSAYRKHLQQLTSYNSEMILSFPTESQIELSLCSSTLKYFPINIYGFQL